MDIRLQHLLAGILFLFFAGSNSYAIEPFTITDIRVTGNGRIDDGTIFNYLPLKVGDIVDDEEVRQSIKTLFDTGFFRNIKLEKDETTLVVNVVERPSIANITLKGNKDIKTEQIMDMLDSAELQQGRIFNQRHLNEVIKGLSDAYFARGRYSANIEQKITLLDQNRASIQLNISEGKVGTIKEINFSGNDVFSTKELLKQMELKSKRGFGFGRKDLYSKQKLEGDEEALRSFYADKGFFDFDLRSTKVAFSPDKKDIVISFNLIEGIQYTFGSVSVDSAQPIELDNAVVLKDIQKGEIYSRKLISESRKIIVDTLSNTGFGVARVTPVPTINTSQGTIDVRFVVDKGPLLYVRRINIVGNIATQEKVIRREMRQLEGARFSSAAIGRSRERLQRLGFFESVNIKPIPIPGSGDEVDLQVTVKERASTGNISFSLGYADVEGPLYQLGYNQRNFLGTGKELLIELDNSKVTNTYKILYTNPYYTVNGVSRGFFLTSTSVDSAEAKTAEYFADSTELGVHYVLPISEDNEVSLALFAEKIDLSTSDKTPPEITNFINSNPDNTNLGSRISLVKDTLNDFIFPTAGLRAAASFNFTVPSSDLEYYKINLTGTKYFELSRSGYSLQTKLKLGFGDSYGEGELPFYKNYFAGGPTTVRGFRSRSLGPKDTGDTPEPLGGDRLLVGRLALLTPTYGNTGSKDKRFTAFIDAGTAYASGDDVELDQLRYSAGISIQWYNILGPLTLSYAVPLNDEEGDKLQKFQISLGTLFR